MQRVAVPCDQSRPISSIHQVWDFLTLRLRELREKLRNINDDLYGGQDRCMYLQAVHSSLKLALDCSKSVAKVENQADLEHLIETLSECKTPRSPRQVQCALEELKSYLARVKQAALRLKETKVLFEDDLLKYLEFYCTNYTKLGIADDKFYQSLRSRTVSINDHMKLFDRLSGSLCQGAKLSMSYFCDCYFSQEVTIGFNCDTFPILRILPDLIQKMEMSCDTASDWLRSDKVYLEQVEKEIEKTRTRVKDFEHQLQLCKLEYEKVYSKLKEKQTEIDEQDEGVEWMWKELAKLEAKKAKVEIELSAVGKTLSGCRDQLRDLSSVEHHGSDSEWEDDSCTGKARLGIAHSSYKSRLCKNAQAQSSKLDVLQKKKKKLQKQIEKKKANLKELEGNETEIQQLTKKLRVIGRQRGRLTEELDGFSCHYKELMDVVKNRLNPEVMKKKKKKMVVKSEKTEKKSQAKKTRPKRSAELHKAFRIVKNNIGLGWKDLARALPYAPAKQIGELNNEIKAIEYENQGQLKEQAYQSLYMWYSHNGRRASVDRLKNTLRELNENRLADNIETEVVLHESGTSSAVSTSTYSTS